MKVRMLLALGALALVVHMNMVQCRGVTVTNNSTKFKISGAVVEMTDGSGCQNMYMQEPPNGPSPLMPGQQWKDDKNNSYCPYICYKNKVLLRIGPKESTGQLAYWYKLDSGPGMVCSSIQVDVYDSKVTIGTGSGPVDFSLNDQGVPSGNVDSAN